MYSPSERPTTAPANKYPTKSSTDQPTNVSLILDIILNTMTVIIPRFVADQIICKIADKTAIK